MQTGGGNYLIPVGVDIKTETRLRCDAPRLRYALDELRAAGNALNIVVLDACRDNPFAWAHSNVRGLSVVSVPPPGSIIVYATSAGSVASDGEGWNGAFTAELLRQLRTPGLEVKDMLNRVAPGVQRASGNKQRPAIYLQFFDAAYLGSASVQPQPDWTPASDFDLSLDGNGLTITKYKGTAAVVNIPPQIDDIPVTAIGERAFEVRGLSSITIPAGVTSIGEWAFYDCGRLSAESREAIRRRFGDRVFKAARARLTAALEAGSPAPVSDTTALGLGGVRHMARCVSRQTGVSYKHE